MITSAASSERARAIADEVSLGHGELAHQCVGRHLPSSTRFKQVARLRAHATPVEQRASAPLEMPREDVLGHAQVGEHCRILVDSRYPR